MPWVVGEIYHVFNRSVARQPIFNSSRDYGRALESINFYSLAKQPTRFSYFQRMNFKDKADFWNTLIAAKRSVDIMAFCLMPNHIHLLLKENAELGISRFMRSWQNSYAKYYNTKNGRTGSLFQAMFKAVRIVSEEQLLHVSRYIHLNPYTGYIVGKIEDLESYGWTSYPDYLGVRPREIVDTTMILGLLGDAEKLRAFTENQADYQRRLGEIKHLLLEQGVVS